MAARPGRGGDLCLRLSGKRRDRTAQRVYVRYPRVYQYGQAGYRAGVVGRIRLPQEQSHPHTYESVKQQRRLPMAFTWQSAGHAFASLFKDVVTVSKKVVTALGGIQKEETLIESLTSLVSPQAAAVEQIAFGALGELVAAVQATETAAGANGINVSFDASVFTEVKKLITDFPEVVAQVEAAFGKSR